MLLKGVTVDLIWHLTDNILLDIIGFDELEKLMYDNAKQKAMKSLTQGMSKICMIVKIE